MQLLQGLHELISQEYYKGKKNYLTKLLEGQLSKIHKKYPEQWLAKATQIYIINIYNFI